MKYFVTYQGTDHGPVDIATLRVWAAEGRLTPYSILKDEQGVQTVASNVLPELLQSWPPMAGPLPYQGGPVGPHPGPYPLPTYGGPGNVHSDYSKARIFCLVGYLLGFPTLCCTFFALGGCAFEIAAICFAVKAKRSGHPSTTSVLIASILGLGINFILLVLTMAVLTVPSKP